MDRTAWDERYRGAELVWSAGPNQFVAREAESLPPGRALDLACGEGRNAVWLAERGWDVTAVDFSAVALDKGRRIAAKRGVEVRWLERDVTGWTADERYDLVVIAYLHLPWAQMTPVLRAAAAAVAPGGTLVVVGHDRSNLSDGHGGPPDPAVLYTATEVAGELGDLEIERAERVFRDVQTDGATARAIDLLVRARRPG